MAGGRVRRVGTNMTLITRVIRGLRALRHRTRQEYDLEEELRAYVATAIDEQPARIAELGLHVDVVDKPLAALNTALFSDGALV